MLQQCEFINAGVAMNSERQCELNLLPAARAGVMIAGLYGNNGAALAAAVLGGTAHSTLGSSVMRGSMRTSSGALAPITECLQLVNFNNMAVSGWDVRARVSVLDALQRNGLSAGKGLSTEAVARLSAVKALPGVWRGDYAAKNQAVGAVHTTDGGMHALRADIRAFRDAHLAPGSTLVVLWSGCTESSLRKSNTAEEVMELERDGLLSASQCTCAAAVMEGCAFVDCAAQGTLDKGMLALATKHGGYAYGSDLKTGQTRIKGVLADLLVNSGMRVRSITSYNHLGNNDGFNLSERPQLESKLRSKRDAVRDIVASNPAVDAADHDHTVVIQYVPSAGDRKKAFDEYVCDVGADQTPVTYTIDVASSCPDTELALGVLLDVIAVADLWCRTRVRTTNTSVFELASPVIHPLAFAMKAPWGVGADKQAYFEQREILRHFLALCAGVDRARPARVNARTPTFTATARL